MAESERSNAGGAGFDAQKPPTLDAAETTRNPSLERVSNPLHEQSPLISPSETEHGEDDGLFDDAELLNEDPHDEFQDTKSVWYMILLTISLGGLSKSLMALVWIAGPLSGALVQPYVGMLSDNCRSAWGKRTPFMIAGSAATIISLLALAWVRDIIGWFLGLFGADRESNGVKVTIIVVAVLFVYILDFAINTVQAGIRAFILDCAPSHQQETANSMASRVVGVGNIIGYVAGYVDLPKHLWFLGNTQFKVLCVIACCALSTTVGISISTIRERDPRLEGPPPKEKAGIICFFKKVFKSIRQLPPQTRKVCEVQFFAWIGFFPQLFYSSSYVGDIYVQPYLEKNPNMTAAELDVLYEQATRVGTFALLMYAITSLLTNVFVPFLIAPTYDLPSNTPSDLGKSYTTRTTRFLDALVIPWLTLRRAWLLSHLIFATCMFSTLIVRSIAAATALIGIIGISWALTIWAPFAIISAEISKRDALRRTRLTQTTLSSEDDENQDQAQAGVILGIHNMAIATPQILATIGSSVIFKFYQKPRGTPGDRSYSFVLACGGIFTLVAAFLTSRIKDEVVLEEEQGYVAVEEGNGGRRSSEVGRRSGESRRSSTLIRNQSYSGMGY